MKGKNGMVVKCCRAQSARRVSYLGGCLVLVHRRVARNAELGRVARVGPRGEVIRADSSIVHGACGFSRRGQEIEKCGRLLDPIAGSRFQGGSRRHWARARPRQACTPREGDSRRWWMATTEDGETARRDPEGSWDADAVQTLGFCRRRRAGVGVGPRRIGYVHPWQRAWDSVGGVLRGRQLGAWYGGRRRGTGPRK